MTDCDKYLELISDYLDTNEMSSELKAHLDTCAACQVELKAMQAMIAELNALPAIPLPEGFHERAMENVRKEQKSKKVRKTFAYKPSEINFSKYTNVAAAVAVCFILFGSALTLANNTVASMQFTQRDNRAMTEGVASWAYPAPAATAPMAAPAAPMAAQVETADIAYEASSADTDAQSALPAPSAARGVSEPRHERPIQPYAEPINLGIVHSNHADVISRNHSITITIEDMEQAVLLLRMAGYEIEHSSISEFGSFLALNIPLHELENARALAASLGEVNFEWEGRTDLTRETNDLAVRYLARLEESTRLASLINRAERAEDIILLQGRISQIEHERARFRGSYNQNLLNSQSVSMSINLNPEGRPIYHAPQSFSERMGTAFTSSVNFTTAAFEGVLVLVASSVVPLALIGAIGGAGYFVYRKVKARNEYKGGHGHEEDE